MNNKYPGIYMSKVLAIFLFGLSTVFAARDASAAVTFFVEMSYESQGGWSAPNLVSITFFSGQEVNSSSSSFSPSTLYGRYAIANPINGASYFYLETDHFMSPYPARVEDFCRGFMMGEMDAKDLRSGKRFKLVAKRVVTWIDPRAERLCR